MISSRSKKGDNSLGRSKGLQEIERDHPYLSQSVQSHFAIGRREANPRYGSE